MKNILISLISFSCFMIMGLLYPIFESPSGAGIYLKTKERDVEDVPINLIVLKKKDQEIEVKNLLIYYFVEKEASLYVDNDNHYYLNKEGKWFSAEVKKKRVFKKDFLIFGLVASFAYLFCSVIFAVFRKKK